MKNWKPIQVKRVYDREFSNTPGFYPHIPIFDEKAIEVLDDLIIDNAEILPLDCEDGVFYAINVVNVIDCIDYEKSKYKTFRDKKRIMRFEKYAFDEKEIDKVNLFKIKDEPLKRPFVSDFFRKRVVDNNLIGFKFELAWDNKS